MTYIYWLTAGRPKDYLDIAIKVYTSQRGQMKFK